MKKYKLLSAKNLLLTLGSAAAIVAPIATVVSCGGPSAKTMDKGAIDRKIASAEMDKINSSMFQTYSGFRIHGRDVYEAVFNNSDTGFLKDVTRFDDIDTMSWNNATKASAFIDKNFVVNGKPQSIDNVTWGASPIIKSANAAMEISLTKQEIIADKNVFKTATTKIEDFISKNPGKYIATVAENVKDEFSGNPRTATNGVYKIYLFKKTDTSSLVQQVANLVQDKTKFGVDMNMVRKLGGTYLWGTWGHSYSMNNGDNGLFGRSDAINTSDSHLDRMASSNNSLKSWTQYAPLTDSSVSQAEIDALKGIGAVGRLEMDEKTHIYNVAITFHDSTSAETFYIPVPEVTSFEKNAYSIDEIQRLLAKNGFLKFYNFMSGFDVTQLDLAGAAKRHVMELMGLLPKMASFMNVIQDDAYMSDLINFTKNYDPSFDWNTFQTSMANMEDKDFGNGDGWGAKRYSLMHHIQMFFLNAEAFAETQEGQKYASKFIDVKDAKAFFDSVKAENERQDYIQKQSAHFVGLDASTLTIEQLKEIVAKDDFIKATDAKYLVGVNTGAQTLAQLKEHVDLEILIQSTDAKYLVGVDKNTMNIGQIKDIIDWNIFKEKYANEINVELASKSLTLADLDSHRIEIQSAVSAKLNVDLSTLQSFIDGQKALGKLIFDPNGKDNGHLVHDDATLTTLQANHGSISFYGLIPNAQDLSLINEVKRLITLSNHQLQKQAGDLFMPTIKCLVNSFNADTISITLKFDSKTSDGAIHHNEKDITLYRHA